MRDELAVALQLRPLFSRRMGRCAVLPRLSSGAQEQRQETPYAQRLVFCAPLEACQPCLLREQCLGRGAQGNRARRVSAVPHVSVKGRS